MKLIDEKIKRVIRENLKKVILESKNIKNITYDGNNLCILSFNMNNAEDKSFIVANKDIIWNILQEGYSHLGGFKGFGSRTDMIKKASMFHIGFQDNEIITVSVYNDYLDGNKCVGAACVRDEKHNNAVMLLEMIIEYGINNWNEWIWVEASGKIEQIFKKKGGFNVPTKYAKIFIRNIPFDDVDDYHYSRVIGGNKEIKTIFGFKDNDTFEFLRKEITDDVNTFLNGVKNEKEITKEQKEIERIWNEFSKNQSQIEKNRDIVNYFVYLKDDELMNEFPKECIEKLKKSILYIQNSLKRGKYDIRKEKQYRLTVEEGLRVIRTSTTLEPIKMNNF